MVWLIIKSGLDFHFELRGVLVWLAVSIFLGDGRKSWPRGTNCAATS